MPSYDYFCDVCKNEFELFHGISDTSDKKCPKCGKQAKRMIGGGVGFIFKGSGFFQTDYKASKKKRKIEAVERAKRRKRR